MSRWNFDLITAASVPTGTNFPDDPKHGDWPDAYDISTREFADLTGPIVGVGADAGQTVRFRFRLATDNVTADEGWYIDDVVVQSCAPGDGLLFANGLESGDTFEPCRTLSSPCPSQNGCRKW